MTLAAVTRRALLSSSLGPPASRGDGRPNGFDDSERPRALEKSIDRAKCAGAGKAKHVEGVALIERIKNQHRGHREQTKDRESVHADELARIVRRSGSGRIRGHALQLPKRIKWSERDEFEAHQVRLAERQFLEHVVRGNRVGYVKDEHNAASTLKREPLIDLAIEIELHRFADFVRQD